MLDMWNANCVFSFYTDNMVLQHIMGHKRKNYDHLTLNTYFTDKRNYKPMNTSL